MFEFILIVLFLNFGFCPAYASVKSDQALIAAVVNQHAITERELELRLDFAIAVRAAETITASRIFIRFSSIP